MHVEIDVDDGLGMVMNNCGYCSVYKQDLQEFNLTMMHLENSLVLQNKFLAIEDEAYDHNYNDSSYNFNLIILLTSFDLFF
jgi:hypothetical protein